MPVAVAQWVALALMVHVTIGLILMVVWHRRGLDPGDPDVSGGSVGFRVLISGALILLWPLVLRRGLTPAPYNEPHDRPNRTDGPPPARTRHLKAILLMAVVCLTLIAWGWSSRPETTRMETTEGR